MFLPFAIVCAQCWHNKSQIPLTWACRGRWRGGWVYVSLWEWKMVMPKWCLALTRPVFQQKQNIQYMIKDLQQNEAHVIQINRLCHSLAVPFNTDFEVLELTPKLSSHSIFMCLLFVWDIVLFSPRLCKCLPCRLWEIHLIIKGWKRKTGFYPAMTFPRFLPTPPFYPQVPYKLCCNAAIIQQSKANQVCRVH